MLTLKRLRQNIRGHPFGTTVLDRQLSGIHTIFHEEKSNVDMSRSLRVGASIFHHRHGAHVVLKDRRRCELVSLTFEEVASPYNLNGPLSQRDKFGFSGGG